MELEIFEALTAANVPAEKARAVAAAIDAAIDRRYTIHSQQLATRGDLMELRGSVEAKIAQSQAEIVKWCMGSIFAAVALFAAIAKIWH